MTREHDAQIRRTLSPGELEMRKQTDIHAQSRSLLLLVVLLLVILVLMGVEMHSHLVALH